MGKSSKKVKSDRINALRKQYDAFLEEDKRRRDRNEYILGWLDRIRTCPTVPSIRIQDNSFEANYKGTSKGPEIVKYQAATLRPANIKLPFIESFEESLILKEISKKYILIPKKSPEIEKDCNTYGEQHILGINDNLDWKNKYNILEELKQKEKEEHIDFGNKDKKELLGDIPIKNLITGETNSPVELIINDKDESLEKNKELEENIYRENVPDPSSINYVQNIQNEQFEKYNKQFNINFFPTIPPNDLSTKYDELETKILQDNLERQSMINVHELQSVAPNVQNNDLKPQIKEYQVNCKDLSQNSIKNNNKDKYNTTSPKNNEIHYEELPQSTIENPGDKNDKTLLKHIEPSKLATENNALLQKQQLENQEVINTSNEGMNIVESSEDIKDSTLYEVNSEHQPDTESTNLVDNNIEGAEIQIQEFETEQKELFYSEDPNENYTYHEENLVGNEEYGNNEQYSYYEATKEDTNQYPTEINEHEESTEQYDPQYGKQYVNSYEGNLIQNEYPTEKYAQDQNLEYQQQQYYDNYEHQQLENNIVTEQQQYENTTYVTSDVEHEENIDDTYNYNVSSEQMASPKTEIEPEKQELINEYRNVDQTAVTYNEDSRETPEVTQEVQNTNLK